MILLASVGPGCVNRWDRLLAAPGAGQLCALVTWRLTPWIARARLAWLGRRQGGALRPGEHVNWQVWGHAGGGRGVLWRTFLTEQRALLRELERAIGSVQAPVLLLADPRDTLVPIDTARRLARALPDARLQLVHGVGHHLPRRAPDDVADAMAAFLAATEESARRSQSRWLTTHIIPPGAPVDPGGIMPARLPAAQHQFVLGGEARAIRNRGRDPQHPGQRGR